MTDFSQYLHLQQTRFNAAFSAQLGSVSSEFGSPNVDLQRLFDAMAYSSGNGGKRVRPVLIYATAEALGYEGSLDSLDKIAAAMEMIHCYSLVHDDLPAMDDDNLRRGHPTCHIAFDEATAILAGDALQCRAFELLTECDAVSAELRLDLVKALTAAAGARGMVGGQAVDLASVGQEISLAQLQDMHRLKTGALIQCSVQLGAIIGGADNTQQASLRDYARAIGLCFQVQDDILDIESSTEVLGKTQGADQALNKPTYPALMGLERAKEYAQQLRKEAVTALGGFADSAWALRELANYIVERKH
jgi:geranylgeranyl pyrophosphate synthase